MKASVSENAFEQQSLLAAYCRTGEEKPLAGVRTGRMQYYRELVFNVVQDTLDTAFPLAKGWMQPAHWNELVQFFFANHSCESAQVWKMPSEFCTFVNEHDLACKALYDGLEDLLRLEWMEIEVFMMEDLPAPACQPLGSIEISPLVVHPEFRVVPLQYPFHQKKAADITAADLGDYYALLFRAPETGDVIFLDISPLHVWMLLQLSDSALSLNDLTAKALAENPGLDSDFLYESFKSFAIHLHEQRLILGTI